MTVDHTARCAVRRLLGNVRELQGLPEEELPVGVQDTDANEVHHAFIGGRVGNL